MTIDPKTWLNWELMGNPFNWIVVCAVMLIWLMMIGLIFGPEET